MSIVNLSFRNRKFPGTWKLSKVTALHKGGSTDNCNNYRPISILPTVSKVLERLVHQQCSSYLTLHGLLSEAQSGFRGGRSTGTCLIEFLDNIYRGIDGGGVCGAVFLDLAKAFDTVNHNVLIEKLASLGSRYSARQWFFSYLSGRTQQTCVEGHLSTKRQVNCGVPQGSILGPLLFICYINDLPLQCRNTIPSLYADDTAILAVGDNSLDVKMKLQEDLNRLFVWFVKNKLSVNCLKTVSVLFTSNRSKYKNDALDLNLNGELIAETNSTKYLGLYVD